MKTFDVPQRGRRGNSVASRNHYGQHQRTHASPNKRLTGARGQARRGFALKLSVAKVPAEDIAVYASPPCSRGRRRCWDLRLVGLLPAPRDGVSNFTTQYLIEYGQPPVGKRIFVSTRQHLNGWKSQPTLISAVVPARQRPARARKPRQLHRPNPCV